MSLRDQNEDMNLGERPGSSVGFTNIIRGNLAALFDPEKFKKV